MIGFALLRYVIKKSGAFISTYQMTKSRRLGHLRFPPFKQVACFYFELLLAPCDNSLALICRCVYISFGLMSLNRTLRQ